MKFIDFAAAGNHRDSFDARLVQEPLDLAEFVGSRVNLAGHLVHLGS